ncbi:D-2-hydroxyacid dehydrogenase [Rubrolithibacter danxiaensis]|uniref:D-2-hydroxyacid dehydrogenase n=1 Tax=Rubrolithibacter danxiaensis TaxID=3390805 RepID=UPI003BF8A938
MKIVVADGYTLNPGDLSWEHLNTLGEVTIYERTPVELLVERCREADIVLTNKVPFKKETLEKLPGLKLISVLATGYNIIDIEVAKKLKIRVCNVPAYGTASVAQHVFALLLELTNHVGLNARATAEGKWERNPDFCFSEKPISELSGKVFGIVGMGDIGEQVARIAAAFGLKVIYNNRNKKQTELAEYHEMKSLFSQSDFISLHCPLTEENQQFVNKDLIELMKRSAFIINTARGQLINEHDLAEALNKNRITGAALDVLSTEPPLSTNPLLKAKNCIITPHNAWMSREARERMMNTTIKNIEAFLNGNAINVVA